MNDEITRSAEDGDKLRTKPRAPKKLSPEVRSAQGAVDSAVVRGESQETVDLLRQKRDAITATQRKKP